MDIGDKIKRTLESSLKVDHFEIKDFTGRHLNHEQHDGGFHLEAIIVSNDFSNKSLIDRHKMIYSTLGDLMKHEIHAFSMKTLTSDEWEKS
jgi:BolA protein|tara:strand:- start:34 stop:306 length:273 start_codon:yes stop_codon:yes gene_type:complete